MKIKMSVLLMIQRLEFMGLELLLPDGLANAARKYPEFLPFQDLIGKIVPITGISSFV